MIKNRLIRLRNGFLTVFGDIKANHHFPWIPYYKPEGYQIRGEQVRKLLSVCRPCDVLLRGFNDYLDGYFIGHWSHVGLVLNERQVIHALAEGVLVEDIINFFRTDRIMVLRPELTKDQKSSVLKRAAELQGTSYDFGFDFNSPNELSCTEFVYYCFEPFHTCLGMHEETIKFLHFIKRKVILPKSFILFRGFIKLTTFE